jgi:hypothetical protein
VQRIRNMVSVLFVREDRPPHGAGGSHRAIRPPVAASG